MASFDRLDLEVQIIPPLLALQLSRDPHHVIILALKLHLSWRHFAKFCFDLGSLERAGKLLAYLLRFYGLGG